MKQYELKKLAERIAKDTGFWNRFKCDSNEEYELAMFMIQMLLMQANINTQENFASLFERVKKSFRVEESVNMITPLGLN